MSITEKDNRLIELVEQWGFLTALDMQMFLKVKQTIFYISAEPKP